MVGIVTMQQIGVFDGSGLRNRRLVSLPLRVHLHSDPTTFQTNLNLYRLFFVHY